MMERADCLVHVPLSRETVQIELLGDYSAGVNTRLVDDVDFHL